MTVEEVRKIKFHKDGKIQLDYLLQGGTDASMKYPDVARPEFYAAMKSLIDPALELLEIRDYEEDIRCTGISFSWTEGVMGAVVTLQKTISGAHSPVVINTPHLPQEPYGEGADDSCLLPGKMVDGLIECIEEAKRYIGGERAQGDLFAGGNGNGSKPEEEQLELA